MRELGSEGWEGGVQLVGPAMCTNKRWPPSSCHFCVVPPWACVCPWPVLACPTCRYVGVCGWFTWAAGQIRL